MNSEYCSFTHYFRLNQDLDPAVTNNRLKLVWSFRELMII